jgi:hypothetical protein
MEIKGRVIQLLPLQTGEGKNGAWRKQEFVIETDAQYPKKICISAWGDKINESLLQVGNEINVSFDLESREYNGRWYTDVKAWRMDAVSTGDVGGSAPATVENSPRSSGPPVFNPISEDLNSSSEADNLPF